MSNHANHSKRALIAGASLAILLSTGYAMYRIGQHQAMSSQANATKNSHAITMPAPASAEKKVLYWHDPMVPGQKFDKPGKSPFMDMQLVPVYADNDSTGNADDGGIIINPRVQQNLGIRTAEVVEGSVSSALVAVGSVAYNERDVVVLQARSNGFVEKLFVRAALDSVQKGQALAELYVPDWAAAQEEYFTATRIKNTSHNSDLSGLQDAAKQRMRLLGMNEDHIRALTASGKVSSRITITAPTAGVVTELSIREGMSVMAGAPLFRINGLSTIWVNADIPENNAAQIRPGSTVEARTPSLPGKIFKGKVSALVPQVDAATRTLKARIELANPSQQLVPGMFATLSFNAASQRAMLLVPSEAVIKTGTRSVVMLAQSEGRFLPVDVETGAETNGRTEIIKGLEVGQKVVVSGQFLLDSEASLRSTGTRVSAPQQTPGEVKFDGKTGTASGIKSDAKHGMKPGAKP